MLAWPVTPILQMDAGMLAEEKVPLAVKVELVEARLRFQSWLVLMVTVLKLVMVYSPAYCSGVLNTRFEELVLRVSCITGCTLVV